jgi:hypothetical protein
VVKKIVRLALPGRGRGEQAAQTNASTGAPGTAAPEMAMAA